MTTTTGPANARSGIHLGSAPDSWGVWMPDDPRQTPWTRFLDEIAAAGYAWMELGPYGYLPTDPARLIDETGRRGLNITGGTVDGGLHRSGAFEGVLQKSRAVAATLASVGARYLVFLPEMTRDIDDTGTRTQAAELTAQEWDTLCQGLSRLGRIIWEEFGITLAVHQHADTHIDTPAHLERVIEGTDPDVVGLCLDTGHIAYCGGDNLAVIARHPERITYVHLKQVAPSVLARVDAEGLSFAQAVRLGAMCEPPLGIPEMPPILDALAGLGRDLFAIVEQDLFPCSPDVPLPIATRTRLYFEGQGIGSGRLSVAGRPVDPAT